MRPTVRVVSLWFVLLSVFAVAFAEPAFRPVPGHGKAKPKLAIRAVAYDGATNGVLTVEIKNTGATPQRFSADGLYFVPNGDPDKAPQRLGAVGPMEIAASAGSEATTARTEALMLAPGQTLQVKLDVFCIDSHRASPSPANTFTVGKTRMPKHLTQTIDRKAKRAADDNGGYAAPAAKSSIQSEVWQSRDRAWIKLDGEGVQEADK